MKDTLFDTAEKRNNAISGLTQLQNNPGWLIVKEVLQANIDILQGLILDGVENETKEQIDMLRDRLKVYLNLVRTPDKLIEQLQGNKSEMPTVDPFYTIEELKKLRKETT